MSYTSIPSSNNSATSFIASREQRQRWAFCTGCLYWIIIVCGFAAELGIRGPAFIDYHDPEATAEHLRVRPATFRRGLLLDVTMSCADVGVSILLVLMLLPVSPALTILSSTFRLMQQAVIAANTLHMFAASLLLDKGINPILPVSSVVDALSFYKDGNNDIAADMAYFFLHLHKYGYSLALIFFGISMLLLGIIVVREGVLVPQWIGYSIALAGGGYLIDSLLYFIIGSYDGSTLLMLPVLVAEFSLASFLVFRPVII